MINASFHFGPFAAAKSIFMKLYLVFDIEALVYSKNPIKSFFVMPLHPVFPRSVSDSDFSIVLATPNCGLYIINIYPL